MDRQAFQIWLSEIDELTEAQKLPEAGRRRRIGGTARGLRRYRCNIKAQ